MILFFCLQKKRLRCWSFSLKSAFLVYLELNDEQAKKADAILKENGAEEVNYKGTLHIEPAY